MAETGKISSVSDQDARTCVLQSGRLWPLLSHLVTGVVVRVRRSGTPHLHVSFGGGEEARGLTPSARNVRPAGGLSAHTEP